MYKFIVIALFNVASLVLFIQASAAQTFLTPGEVDINSAAEVHYLQNVDISIIETTEPIRAIAAQSEQHIYEDYARAMIKTADFPKRWYIERYDFQSAWAYEPVRTTKVAIIDTGISEELLVRQTIQRGINLIDSSKPPIDDNGHGTALASIITDVSGPYPIEIIPIKAANSKGLLTIANIIQALDYAIEIDADFINLSFGAKTPHDLEQQAIEKAIEAGITIVSSVGNSGIEEYYYPAAYPRVLGIGAINEQHIRASFSTYNDVVDFVAPGENLVVRSHTAVNTYTTVEGTSFSSAYFTAQLALLHSTVPSYSMQQVTTLATDLGIVGYDKEYGNGLLIIDQLLHALRGKNWPTTNVDAFKTWTITLSALVDTKQPLENDIHLYNQHFQAIPISIDVLNDKKLTVTPKSPLAPGNYWLAVDASLQSKNGTRLTQPVLKPFRVND